MAIMTMAEEEILMVIRAEMASHVLLRAIHRLEREMTMVAVGAGEADGNHLMVAVVAAEEDHRVVGVAVGIRGGEQDDDSSY